MNSNSNSGPNEIFNCNSIPIHLISIPIPIPTIFYWPYLITVIYMSCKQLQLKRSQKTRQARFSCFLLDTKTHAMTYFSPGMQSIQHEYIQFQHVKNLIYTVYKVGLHLIDQH